jgi:arginase
MAVVLVQVPYALGRREEGLAKGVPVLAEALADELDAESVVVEPAELSWNEAGASFDVVRALAASVLVVGGVCSSCLGAVAGLGSPSGLGVVWFDAHGDFNTPDSTPTGFFDGMPLAMLTGSGYAALRASVDGLSPVDERNVVLVGARDLDPAEEARLESSAVTRVAAGEAVTPALEALAARTRDVYVHVDLDVLDPSEGQANRYRSPNGMTADAVAAAVAETAQRFRIRAAAITAYEPVFDPEGRVPAAAVTIARQLVGAGVTA